jgi:hypothetical protein
MVDVIDSSALFPGGDVARVTLMTHRSVSGRVHMELAGVSRLIEQFAIAATLHTESLTKSPVDKNVFNVRTSL